MGAPVPCEAPGVLPYRASRTEACPVGGYPAVEPSPAVWALWRLAWRLQRDAPFARLARQVDPLLKQAREQPEFGQWLLDRLDEIQAAIAKRRERERQGGMGVQG